MTKPRPRHLLTSVFAALFSALTALIAPTLTRAAPTQATPPAPAGLAKATFAGGCFWCMEPPFDKLDGVISTTSGYIGGKEKGASYAEVSAGATSHTEAVEIVYDPKKVSYAKLLEIFWKNIDPITKDRQFCDGGKQYRTGIFFHDAEQQKLAESSKALLNEGKPYEAAKPVGFKGGVVTEITKATEFWAAEDYHQDYYLKNPVRYKYYRTSCGRDSRLEQLWGAAK